MLSENLKLPSTLILDTEPKTCPACQCVRFEQQEKTLIDRALKRRGRYKCNKCATTTLYVYADSKSETENLPSSHQPAVDSQDEMSHKRVQSGRAKFRLACRYAAGQGIPANSKAAFILFEQAAALGHVKAQYNTAVYLLKFHGQMRVRTEEERRSEARYWLQLAATGGYRSAELLLERIWGTEAAA